MQLCIVACTAHTGLKLGTAAACCFQTLRNLTQHSETQCQGASHGRLLKFSQGGSLCCCPPCPFFPFVITLFPFVITFSPFHHHLVPFHHYLVPFCHWPVHALLTLLTMFSLLVLLAAGYHALLLAVPALFPCDQISHHACCCLFTPFTFGASPALPLCG